MDKLIKLEFYSEYMDKITSFHYVNEKVFNTLNELKNDKSLFFENFYRVSKSIYKHLTNDNFFIYEVEEENVEIIDSYLKKIGNNTDLLDLINAKFDISASDSEEYIISDEDLTETFNINKLIKLKLNNDNKGIEDLFINNPSLKDNDELFDILE
jgi:hypothetical protein